jgi:hypothetical protein
MQFAITQWIVGAVVPIIGGLVLFAGLDPAAGFGVVLPLIVGFFLLGKLNAP